MSRSGYSVNENVPSKFVCVAATGARARYGYRLAYSCTTLPGGALLVCPESVTRCPLIVLDGVAVSVIDDVGGCARAAAGNHSSPARHTAASPLRTTRER